MLLLVIDTSGKHGTVGLVRAENDSIQVTEEVPLTGGTFSAQLVPQIAGLLEKHGLRKQDIGAFVVASGPGSFTGLRVGLAAIKALAEILQKPIVPVSLLEVIALNGAKENVLAALDAGRGEVYAGEYRMVAGSRQKVREQLLPKQELFEISTDVTIATPDSQLADSAGAAGRSAFVVERPNARALAQVGWKKLQGGESVPPEQLEANYIRRSDAEIFSKPASSS